MMQNFCTRSGGSEVAHKGEEKITISFTFVLPNYPTIVQIFLKINCTVEMTVCCFKCR